jgi:hypothetical protein
MLPLQDTDREIAVKLIAANVVNSADPVPALQAIIGPKALDIQSQSSPNKWAEVAVRFCQELDWDEQGRHPLVKLLAQVAPLNARIPQVIQMLESIPRPEDPFTARILDNGQAFLGRTALRQFARDMLKPAGPCVLRIFGKGKVGKSYSLKLLLYLQLQKKGLKPVQVEYSGRKTPALTVATTMVRRMGADPGPGPNLGPETGRQAGQLLADWVLNLALRGTDNWWFVLDGFTDPELPDDSDEFIKQLAQQIAQGPARERMRVVLVDSDVQLSDDLRRLQRKDELKLDRDLWESVVRDYYAALALTLPPAKQPDLADAIDDTLDQIKAAKDSDYLRTLCIAVEEATLALADA